MPNITAPTLAFPSRSFPGAQAGVPAGIVGELVFSEVLGKYATLAKAQKLFYASITWGTAPASFLTAAQFGPVLWNRPGSNIDAYVVAIGISNLTTANTGGGAIGWASNVQVDAPTTPTAIVAWNAYAGGGPSQLGGVFSTATVGILPTPKFWPLTALTQGAITINALSQNWIDINGALVVGPGTVGYVCGSAVLTATVSTATIVWAELST
jgi:hypothetical protein